MSAKQNSNEKQIRPFAFIIAMRFALIAMRFALIAMRFTLIAYGISRHLPEQQFSKSYLKNPRYSMQTLNYSVLATLGLLLKKSQTVGMGEYNSYAFCPNSYAFYPNSYAQPPNDFIYKTSSTTEQVQLPNELYNQHMLNNHFWLNFSP